ncbi:MAG: L-threonylcarbamoyladenylate synthase [Anaerolineae bacterium]
MRRSFVVSDRLHEVELANKVGAQGIYIASERRTQPQLLPVSTFLVAADIWEAALSVMERSLFQQGQDILPDVKHAAVTLRNGGVVAFPTETVYGLGANAFDPMAVARVFEIKGRPRFDPLIVHVATLHQVKDLVTELPEQAQELMRFFWPGPLTIVLPKSSLIPDIITAGLPTVAIRMPDHPIALTLIRNSGVPVAAPSANLFGHVSPTTADHVRQQLGKTVDWVLDGGRCPVGVESTVISVLDKAIMLLRPGGTPLEEIERVVGPIQRRAKVLATPMSPGQLPYHYAPRTPLVLKGQNVSGAALRRGLLSFTVPASTEGFVAIEVLSKAGDLREAAANLFAALHRLDAMQLDVIVAELVPEVGLGLAINDRLCRAARKRDSRFSTDNRA